MDSPGTSHPAQLQKAASMIPGMTEGALAALVQQTTALMTERVRLVTVAHGNIDTPASVQTDMRVQSLHSDFAGTVTHYQWIYVLVPVSVVAGVVQRIEILESATSPDFVGVTLGVESAVIEPGLVRRYRCQRQAG